MTAVSTLSTLETSKSVATVYGQPFNEFPRDLYIPPQALEILLDTFCGPLDFLLYLIKKQNFDILDIPVAEVTRQYLHYIDLMQVLEIELATEYLVMAALLTEIKSRLLLPKPVLDNVIEDTDPRVELIRRLQEYEQIKLAACELDKLPQQNRDVFFAMVQTKISSFSTVNDKMRLSLDLRDLGIILQSILTRATLTAHHAVTQEPLSIQKRMSQILYKLSNNRSVTFTSLFALSEGRMGVVVTFIALLELWRQALIELIQTSAETEIEIKIK